jgi:hypothetical protein
MDAMDETREPQTMPTGTAVDPLPPQRSCTRCPGHQHLIGAHGGMGKYRCDTCELVVGFDLDAERPEFLIERGVPGRYTKDVFGERLGSDERRLTSRA